MNNLRTLLCFVLAAAIVAFALPSVASNDKKQYSLSMTSLAPLTVTASLKSLGNSTISSFKLTAAGATIVGVDQPASGKATFTSSTVSVTNMVPQKAGGAPFYLTIHLGDSGDGISWSAMVWTGAQLNGQTFDLVPGQSTLATPILSANVGSNGTFNVPNSSNPCVVTGQRGFYDKDGSTGGTLPLFVTNTVSTNHQVHFRWPDGVAGDPRATFEYSVCDTIPADLAWLTDSNGPAFIPALNCIEPNQLPMPYGTLSVDLGPPGDETQYIAIDTMTPPPGPPAGSIPFPAGTDPFNPNVPGSEFDIVIGTERITVQFVCLDVDDDGDDPGDCTDTDGEGEALMVVQRAVGGTSVPDEPHTHGALVMSTPLPILPEGTVAPYAAGNQAQMCIAHRDDGTKVIDIGDGYVKLP
jgi:hypothetical protein